MIAMHFLKKAMKRTLNNRPGEQRTVKLSISKFRSAAVASIGIVAVSSMFAGEVTVDIGKLNDGPLWGQDGWESPAPKQTLWRSPVVNPNLDSEISARLLTACAETSADAQNRGSEPPQVAGGASRFVDLAYSGESILIIEFAVQRTSGIKGAIGGMVGVGSTDRYPATAGLFFEGWAVREESTSRDGVGGEVHHFRYKPDGSLALSEINHWYQVRVVYNLKTQTGGDPSASIEIKDLTAGEPEFTKLCLDQNGERREASLGLSSQVASWDNLVIRLGSSEANSVTEGGAITNIKIYWSKD